MKNELKHIGVARRSGRYPWGSGDHGYQRGTSIRGYVKELKKQGLSEKQIADGLGFKSTSQLRAEISLEKAAQIKSDAALAQRLKDKGYSNVEIGKRMNKNESSIRDLLDPVKQERALITERTADMLRAQLDKKPYLDIGTGIENQAGVARTTLDVAIAELQKSGYKVQYIKQEQFGTGKKTLYKVLTKDDVDYPTLIKNMDQIRGIDEWSDDGGRTWLGIKTPTNIDSKRIAIKYGEEGGKDMDGVIQLRRGVDDISLGESKYAQVRIAVDGTHYLKGMAVYSDDMPTGVDIIFNTNKPLGTPKIGSKNNTVLKLMEDDPDNPFGSEVRQRDYIDKFGKEKLSAINIVNEEGDWAEWSKTLSSQMLSKQEPSFAKQQLDLAVKIKQEEFDDYMRLTNPVVKAKLLQTFADECDADAVDLKAAAMPRQSTHAILPATMLKLNEIYAPNYEDGESVVLIRHPHGGIFEIPELTVNNKNPEAKSIFGQAIDAIGIHPEVAKKLSGADFDGDTVLVIPNNNRLIKTAPSLKALADFDPITMYPERPGMKYITKANKGTEMGKISNLITDMTIKGATQDEIARAVRHSMVVIDAEKHKLDYSQSFQDNGIAQLKQLYQGGANAGASTIISKASAQMRVDRRKEGYRIDPATGKKIFTPNPESYVNKDGKTIWKKTLTTPMYETEDAYSLSSGTRIESVYADYANAMKALGDRARKEVVNTPRLEYSPSAKKTYAREVESLLADLSIAISNRPIERQAVLLANKILRMKRQANPGLTPKEIKKIKGQALAEARARTGAKKQSIKITSKQWEAIQAGAVSHNILAQILNNTDLKIVKEHSTPRASKQLSTAKITKARVLLSRGYTQAEVASMLMVSPTFLMSALKEKGGG
jgi:hypothetical protein